MFDSLSIPDARPVALMKRVLPIPLALFVITAAISGHRAYYQVRSLELGLNDAVLREGSVIAVGVTGSGRTTVDVKLELIQGTHSETLTALRVRGNEWPVFDPRPTHGARSLALTPDILSRFADGAATLRATAVGRPQWTRLPPPTVSEAAVVIRRE
jgi:hypothetical protein